MEGETRRRRKPLSDRTNTNPKPTTRSSVPKLPPPTTRSAADKKHQLIHNASESHNKRNRKSAQSTDVANKENIDHTITTTTTLPDEKHQLVHSASETHNKRRRKSAPLTDVANKENVDPATTSIPESSSPPSTPSITQPLSPLDEPLTVYARRQRAKGKGKEKVVNEVFTCPPIDRKRNKSSTASPLNASKFLTDPPKKRRIKERVVSKDYIEQQRAYFAEIDKCELPVEEVSESELSDH